MLISEKGWASGRKRNILSTTGALECKLLNFRIEPEWFVETEHRIFRPELAGTLTKPAPATEMFSNRLRKNLKRLKKRFKRKT